MSVSMYLPCMHSAQVGQKRPSDPLNLELQAAVSLLEVDAENWTQALNSLQPPVKNGIYF